MYFMKCVSLSASCPEDNGFQCYDGTCIPNNQECDGIVDCAGMYHEDEPADCGARSADTCLQWRMMGYTKNGKYTVNLAGSGEFQFFTKYLLIHFMF